METLEELQQQLLVVSSAIETLLRGERVDAMELEGAISGGAYRFGVVTLDALRREKDVILKKIEKFNSVEGSKPFRGVEIPVYGEV